MPGSPNNTSPKEQRVELLKRWEHAQQDFRDVGAHTANWPVLFAKLTDKYYP